MTIYHLGYNGLSNPAIFADVRVALLAIFNASCLLNELNQN